MNNRETGLTCQSTSLLSQNLVKNLKQKTNKTKTDLLNIQKFENFKLIDKKTINREYSGSKLDQVWQYFS